MKSSFPIKTILSCLTFYSTDLSLFIKSFKFIIIFLIHLIYTFIFSFVRVFDQDLVMIILNFIHDFLFFKLLKYKNTTIYNNIIVLQNLFRRIIFLLNLVFFINFLNLSLILYF
jgi:hypothetical protein